jgi:hypothetical protein
MKFMLIFGIGMAILVLLAVIFLLMRRKSLSYELVIIGDNRRNSPVTGRIKFNMRVGAQGGLKAVKIYNNLISFSAAKVMTEIADPKPFVWFGRTVFGILGPTGGPEDDNIILVPRPKLTGLDVERWAMMHSDKIRNALQPMLLQLGAGTLNKENAAKFVQDTFTEKWVLLTEGAGQNFLNKDDVLPRSLKVAYTSEIKSSFDFEAKHQDFGSKLLALMPVIIVVVLLISSGIFLDMSYQAAAGYLSSANAAQQQMFTFEQAQSYAIGHALAIAGVYGYNYTPTSPAPIQQPALVSGIPSVSATIPKP